MTYQFQVGDYIAFKRIVQPKRPVRHRTDYATGRAIVVPEIAEQILPQCGEAQIQKISPSPRRIVIDRTSSGEVVTELVNTARAAAGKPLGTVTVILDDAVLVAKQQGLFDTESLASGEASAGMYGTDVKGGA